MSQNDKQEKLTTEKWHIWQGERKERRVEGREKDEGSGNDKICAHDGRRRRRKKKRMRRMKKMKIYTMK